MPREQYTALKAEYYRDWHHCQLMAEIRNSGGLHSKAYSANDFMPAHPFDVPISEVMSAQAARQAAVIVGRSVAAAIKMSGIETQSPPAPPASAKKTAPKQKPK